jgi:hypothetical protein
MRLQDTVTIAKFGPYRIKAIYDYRIEVPYTSKHDGPDVKDLHVDKIELKIEEEYFNQKEKTLAWRTYRTVTLLDIPPWLWELLNSPSMLRELDLGLPIESDSTQSVESDS